MPKPQSRHEALAEIAAAGLAALVCEMQEVAVFPPAMHRVLSLFLFSFILGAKAARPAHKANETLNTCCCFRPHTGTYHEYTGTTPCPKRSYGSKDKTPRGCATGGDTDKPCQYTKHFPNGVPDPGDLYCENYVWSTCGEHKIFIPDEWRDCYRKTSKYRYGDAVDPKCPQCKFPYDSKGEC